MKSWLALILAGGITALFVFSTRPTNAEINLLVAKMLTAEKQKAEEAQREIKYFLSCRTAIITTSEGAGTGTIVSADGHIISELHVVGHNSDPNLLVTLADRTITAEAITILDFDEIADMALLKVSGPTLNFSSLLDEQSINELEQGTKLWLVGNSYGCSFPYIAEATFFHMDTTTDDHHVPYLATIGFNSQGTSGGGLYTESGGYIGMYHAICKETGGSPVGLSLHGTIVQAMLEKNHVPFAKFIMYK